MDRMNRPGPCSLDYHPSRRDFLARAGGGFGAIALASLLQDPATASRKPSADPLAPRAPHFAPRAKRVIWCFMDGGPSHLDLLDPKPELARFAGQPLPPSF